MFDRMKKNTYSLISFLYFSGSEKGQICCSTEPKRDALVDPFGGEKF